MSPPSARVGPSERVNFTATVTGTATTNVTWSVQEGTAGGSIALDGRYIAPAANGTYHVVAASLVDPAKSAAATVVVTGEPPPVNGAPMTTANRTSGVAPLAVFFDAVDTVPVGSPVPGDTDYYAAPYTWTSGVTQLADMEGAQWSWNFGDPGAGVWSATGNSRNSATGYTAGHVFETPGTYTVTLVVTDTLGVTRTYTQAIAVSAFSGETRYVSSSSGNDAWAGTEAAPWASLSTGITWVNGAANRRLLLKRGDGFTTTPIRLSRAQGAGQAGFLGAYGSGARPVLNVGGTGASTGGITIAGNDWRVMDLEVVGPGASSGMGPGITSPLQTTMVNALVLRCYVRDFAVGINTTDDWPIVPYPHDGFFMVENEVPNSYNGNVFVGGRRLAVLGNNLHDAPVTHVLRVWQAHKGVISNNRAWNSGPQRHALKLHGPARNASQRDSSGRMRPETRWVSVSDNLFRAAPTGPNTSITVGIGAQGDEEPGWDERVSHVVFERNLIKGAPSVSNDMGLWGSHLMVRNNVFNGTGINSDHWWGTIYVEKRGSGTPPPNDVRILNNTIVKYDAGGGCAAIKVFPEATNVVFRNNLMSFPSVSNDLVRDTSQTPGTGYVEANNLKTDTPGFTNFAGGEFSLLVTAPAVNAGATLSETCTDYLGVPRSGAYDIGAIESPW